MSFLSFIVFLAFLSHPHSHNLSLTAGAGLPYIGSFRKDDIGSAALFLKQDNGPIPLQPSALFVFDLLRPHSQVDIDTLHNARAAPASPWTTQLICLGTVLTLKGG